MNIGKWLVKHAPTILTWLGAASFVCTVSLVAIAAPEAEQACEEARAEKQKDELTTAETIKAAAPVYLPAVAAGITTLMCMFSANAVSRRRERTLCSAYCALMGVFNNYRHKVAMLGGEALDRAAAQACAMEDADVQADAPPWDVPQTFFLEGYPEFFERTAEEVVRAEYILNRQFVLAGMVTFNDLLRVLDLKPIGEKGEHLGWEAYLGETTYGYRWIDFTHTHRVTDDGMAVCDIHMPFAPHSFDEDSEERVSVCGVE